MTQSSYLMSFIRSLMENSSKDVREKKKKLLEKDFSDTGEALNCCLTEKFNDVSKILTVYSSVSERVSGNIHAVTKIKKDLVDCKSLLYCNREELRRLWLELVEQRHCLELIDHLDRLRSTPDAIVCLIGARAWLEATSLVVNANEILNSDISSIPATQSIKSDIAHKQKFLADELRKELNRLIYEQPRLGAAEIRAQQSGNEGSNNTSSLVMPSGGPREFRRPSNTMAISRYSNLPLSDWHTVLLSEPIFGANLYKEPRAVATALAVNSASMADDPNKCQSTMPSADWVRGIVSVTHCLNRMQKLSSLLSEWRPQSHISQMVGSGHEFSAPLVLGQGLVGELHRLIVLKIFTNLESKAMSEGAHLPLSESNSTKYLTKFLELVFDSLFLHARSCLLVLRTMFNKQIFGKTPRDLNGLDGQYIWSCVQHEIHHILLLHLNATTSEQIQSPMNSSTTNTNTSNTTAETNNLDNAVVGNTIDPTKLDLNSLMGRKRLGAFNFSSQSITTSSNATKPQDTNSQMNTAAGAGITGSTISINNTNQNAAAGNSLFTFANTSHYMGLSSYLNESRVMTAETSDTHMPGTSTNVVYPLVCRPSRMNILCVYKMVKEFIESIEMEMAKPIDSAMADEMDSLGPSNVRQHSQLRMHLKNFISNTFLPETLTQLRTKLQQKLSASDALSAIVSQQTERELGLNRPILTIVYTVDLCLNEVKQMCIALPEYGSGCLQIGFSLLDYFIAAIWRIYKGLGESENSGAVIPSGEWSKDDDVSRFWKKFPSWQRMATHEARLLASNALLDTSSDGLSKIDPSYTKELTSQYDPISTGTDASNEADAYISPSTAIALGLFNDPSLGQTVDISTNSRLVIPFANVQKSAVDVASAKDKSLEFMRLPGFIYEREATRLAATETDQLIHMINDELPTNLDKRVIQLLPTIRNIQSLKVLSRLTESLFWLCHRVLSLDTWLQNIQKRPNPGTNLPTASKYHSSRTAVTRQPVMSALIDTPFLTRAKELNRASEACLLMTYLEVRIKAYNHFGRLPPDISYWCLVDNVDVDTYVTDFLSYLEQVKELLISTFSRHKFRFIFDGLGDFISQLLLRLIPQITRMNANGNKKMSRNVYRLQQALATLTETHESDLIRVKQLYELFHLSPEAVVNRLMEQGTAFEHTVYADLLHLYQRSHPTYDFAKTQASISKLATVNRARPN